MNFEMPNSVFNNEENEQRMFEDVARYVHEHVLRPSDLEKAYLIALGISPDTVENEVIYVLAQKIDEHMKNGLSATKIKEAIEFGFEDENALQNYTVFVNTMKITDREKDILLSIVEKKRPGELQIRDLESGQVSTLKIDQKTTEYPKDVWALAMMSTLKEYTARPVSITFES